MPRARSRGPGERRPRALRAIVTQTADPRWNELEPGWFPDLKVVLDGRNSLDAVAFPEGVTRRGIGKTGS